MLQSLFFHYLHKLRNAHLPDYKQVINAGIQLDYDVISIQLPDVALPTKFQSFIPSELALKDAGVSHTLSMHHKDIFAITQQLQIMANEYNLQIDGIIPLSEVGVEVSDLIASCLGLPHNPLELLTARRDKGIMKHAVQQAGLRIAKYARISSIDDLHINMQQLQLTYPIVVKVPSGFSTTGVYICSNENEAIKALNSIIGKTGPDGRTVNMALLEEYIDGTEFAINLMAFSTPGEERLLVTDMWKYQKTKQARYDNAEICNPENYPELVSYACDVAKAVGVQCGAAHVELKARQDEKGKWCDPVMIEVGARLSGGRKSTMAQAAIADWDPFTTLIESHCGMSCRRIPNDINYLIPKRFVRHLFLPVEKAGEIKMVRFDEAMISNLPTIHSSVMIVKTGDVVEVTTDIVSCAGFVWLVGEKSQVDKDTKAVLDSFSLILDDEEKFFLCKSIHYSISTLY